MVMVILVNKTDANHLAVVKAEMQELGSPIIRAIDAGDHIIAVEGSHRLQAAEELGLPVHFEMIADESEVDLDTLDWDDMGWFDERVISGREFIEGFTRSDMIYCQPVVEVEVA